MQPGTRLEHYEIVAPIGEGGMGAVYRAEDTRLKRTVAIKVLPPELAADPERLARLEREAQLLASLNHPNVATVHGLGQDTVEIDGQQRPVTFLVMELVGGASLHDRVAVGSIPWREAVGIASGIAAGLEAAHERGIVHRDLKPANVHVDDEGQVKVLDFGLAKAFEGDHASGSLELSASPTVAAATRTGMILGTAAYMSPEQARGKAVDKRSDIWALGCVLYEMLTGSKAFDGETVSDVLAAILKEEPDLDALPPVPVRLRLLLERCLAKQPAQRMRDVGDVRLELQAAREEAPRAAVEGAGGRGVAPWLAAAVALAGVALGLLAGYVLTRPEPPREMRLLVSPDSIAVGPRSLVISPDGRWIAESDIAQGIRLRAVDGFEWRDLPNTIGALTMAFTADSRRLFFTRGLGDTSPNVYSVGLDGSSPTTEVELGGTGAASVFRGADGTIHVGVGFGPSWRVLRRQGQGNFVEVAEGLIDAEIVTSFVGGEIAPGRWIAWTFTGSAVGSLAVLGAGEATSVTLLDGYRSPVVVEGGRVLAVDDQARLVSLTVDPDTGAIVEPPVIQIEGLGLSAGVAGAFDITGRTLVYMHGTTGNLGQTLSWLSEDGDLTQLTQRTGTYQVDSRVSPDGSRLALEVQEFESTEVSIWVHELDRDVQTALTPGLPASFPVWSPDGRELAFYTDAGEAPGLYRAPVDRSAEPSLLVARTDGRYPLPTDWSPDGSTILYVSSPNSTRSMDAGNDLWLAPVDGSEPRPFLATGASEIDGRIAPDGGWVAYASNQTGRYEVYVRPLGGGGEFRISASGGTSPEWDMDHDRIFFQRGQALFAVDIHTDGATPVVSAERHLLDLPLASRESLWHPHPDGDRFLVAVSGNVDADSRSVRMILDWNALRR